MVMEEIERYKSLRWGGGDGGKSRRGRFVGRECEEGG